MPRLPQVSLVRLLLLLLNVISTLLMLFLELRDNRIVAQITGQNNFLQRRLIDGGVNTAIVESEHFNIEDLPSPKELATYIFLSTPHRNRHTTKAYNSICTNINTNAAPVMVSYFDDFWGKGPRRIQYYANSISAPHCEVLNVKPAWRDKCVANNNGNATLCHQYVLDNYDTLKLDRSIRMGVVKDFGGIGVPFLRCLGRPLTKFAFHADMLVHQTFWAGGDLHMQFQTSKCEGAPLVRSKDLKYTLFQSLNVDEDNDCIYMMPRNGWFSETVAWLQTIVMLAMVVRAVLLALFHTRAVQYLPEGIRVGGDRRWIRYLMPFMGMVTQYTNDDRAVITFKGSLLLASDVWMSHWLYMWLSMLDAICNIRFTYVTLQVATSLLGYNVTIEAIIFLIQSFTRITWVTCLAQTLLRIVLKVCARVLRAIRLIRSSTRETIEWHLDGMFMFMSYRVNHLILCIVGIALVYIKDIPSFMVRANPYRVGVYGGTIEIHGFWGSEVACDLVSLIGIQSAIALFFGFCMLFTKYRYVANNNVMRFIQQRFVICGWDGLMIALMLGLDPYDSEVLVEGRAFTQCSLGSLLQVMFLTGPSGFVHLGGDYIFHDGGFSKEPVKFTYTVSKAMSMGLLQGSTTSSGTTDGKSSHVAAPSSVHKGKDDPPSPAIVTNQKTSIFDRQLRLVSEGYLGRLLMIDLNNRGKTITNKESGRREFEVTDALTTMTIMDIKWLLGNSHEKRLHFE